MACDTNLLFFFFFLQIYLTLFKRQINKLAKHKQFAHTSNLHITNKQFADELFECVRPFCGIGA